MKHVVIAGLLAAIGAVVLANGVQAESRYCYDNPDDNRCDYDPDFRPRLPPPPPAYDPGFDPDDEYAPPPPRPRPPGPRLPELGDYDPPPPPGVWGADSRRRFCFRVGQSLREYGYRRVRAADCGGKNFKYTAYRGYQRYLIKVQARTGRIIYEFPN